MTSSDTITSVWESQLSALVCHGPWTFLSYRLATSHGPLLIQQPANVPRDIYSKQTEGWGLRGGDMWR